QQGQEERRDGQGGGVRVFHASKIQESGDAGSRPFSFLFPSSFLFLFTAPSLTFLDMSKLMRSVSGIRGIVGPDFNPVVIARYVNAFVRITGARRVVVGRDTRPTGPMVEQAVAASLTAAGADAVMLGMTTTPTVEMAVITEKADAGIIITASHNPLEWNALKFLNGEGIFLDEEAVRKLFALVDGE